MGVFEYYELDLKLKTSPPRFTVETGLSQTYEGRLLLVKRTQSLPVRSHGIQIQPTRLAAQLQDGDFCFQFVPLVLWYRGLPGYESQKETARIDRKNCLYYDYGMHFCGEIPLPVRDTIEIAGKIKTLQKKKGLPQQDLAEIHISYLSRPESGYHEPSIDILKKFTDIFEVSADYLLNDEQDGFEIRIKDKNLAERMSLLDTLEEDERAVIVKIINSMLTNKKMRNLLGQKSDVLWYQAEKHDILVDNRLI